VRIIAGERRGMKLLSPPGMDTRPVTDRVKESLFSILLSSYGLPEGAKVGDVFSGTGSFGLEALSRGADCVTFVDMGKQVVEVLNKNIERAGYENQSAVVCCNAFKSGAPVTPGLDLYDLAFVDPPFPLTRETDAKSQLGKMLFLMNSQIVEGGLVLVRTHIRSVLDESYGNLKVIERREWGTMAETFLQLELSAESDIEE